MESHSFQDVKKTFLCPKDIALYIQVQKQLLVAAINYCKNPMVFEHQGRLAVYFVAFDDYKWAYENPIVLTEVNQITSRGFCKYFKEKFSLNVETPHEFEQIFRTVGM